jgi:hypothetical protein
VGAISSVGPLGLDVVGLIAHLQITLGNMFNAWCIFHSLVLCSAFVWLLKYVET